ncbi:MAG: hypothetical protein RMK29_21410 [Myxococcales bacterium]|nr:hypothetical protein [Myxococcota bacterium]MDW8284270.1 hypothetical protein [Myxococcales bacterium]
MPTLLQLVPHRSTTTSVRLWAGAWTDGSPPGEVPLTLRPGPRTVVLPATAWRPVLAGGHLPPTSRRIFVQVVRLEGLQPGSVYRVEGPGCQARLSTLPQDLPGPDDRPFTLLLASCFYQPNDAQGSLGRAVQQLPDAFQPDVKLLCGDQVYLDLPLGVNFPDDTRWMADAFLGKYVHTFFQHGGFASLLERGATYFAPDDHEYWNNFPNPSVLVNNSWSASGRARWRQIALDLYRDFQTDDPQAVGSPQRFEVGPLSFLVVDTRTHRGEGSGPLLRPADRDALLHWVQNLCGPGVLGVCQPVLDTPGTWFQRTFKDRALPDYPDYGELVRALLSSRHSVLVLCGDVHFGRVASCELRGGPSSVRLVEVISSPTSLCHPLVGGRAGDAPARFPAASDGSVTPRPTRTHYKTAEEHFVTIQFYQRAGHTEAAVRFWFPRSVRFGSTRFHALPPIRLS